MIYSIFVIFVFAALFGGKKGKKKRSTAGSGQNGYVYSHKNR